MVRSACDYDADKSDMQATTADKPSITVNYSAYNTRVQTMTYSS